MDRVKDEYSGCWQNDNFTEIVARCSSSVPMDAILDEFGVATIDSQEMKIDEMLNYINNEDVSVELNEMEPLVPNQGIVPSDINYLGDFNFYVDFEPDPAKITKSLTWTYSNKLQRLYVNKNKSWPVQVHCDDPPENCYVRATLVYKDTDHMSTLVARCPNHMLDDSGLAEARAHVLRSMDASAVYQEAQDSKRHSVAVSYVPPQAGNLHSTYFYSFACLTSCAGGMNRKPVKVIFTLEQNGAIIGRAVIETRCCASPGRDRMAEEKKLEVEPLRKRPRLTRQNSSDSGSSGQTVESVQRSESQAYFVKADNKEDYKMLTEFYQGVKSLRMVQSRLSQAGPCGMEISIRTEAGSSQSQSTDSSSSDSQQQRRRRIRVHRIKLATRRKMEPQNDD